MVIHAENQLLFQWLVKTSSSIIMTNSAERSHSSQVRLLREILNLLFITVKCWNFPEITPVVHLVCCKSS